MSNRAYFVGGNTNEPLGHASECDHTTQVLCGASYRLPVFWLCCFDESDVRYVDGDRVPVLFTETSRARQRCAQRAPRVLDTFAAHADRWPEWLALLNGCEFAHITADGYEVWCMMEPSDFESSLLRALHWFDTGAPVDREALFELACIERYDAARRAIVHDRREYPGMFLHGYREARPVPWNDE
jgi:hypothetical protein